MRGATWMRNVGAFAVAASLGVATVPTDAQQSHSTGMPMEGTPGAQGGSMMGAMQKMQRDMAAQPETGNTDQDFVAMMIPHHQGAIDMARAELATGKDPELRKLAEDIVKAQEREIQQMRDWQKKNPATR
jgi:uncharacterized protein (DUF305 family)